MSAKTDGLHRKLSSPPREHLPSAIDTSTGQAMKRTVLFITSEPVHWKLYRARLEERFRVEIDAEPGGRPVVDAIIYDIPNEECFIDYCWLEALDLPVVVLTCQDALSTPEGPRRKILTYPVRADQILRALTEMGI